MRVDLFDFELPEDRIAQAPAELRDSARLLHVGPELADRRVADLPALLRPGDIMVVNDTRVLPCRLTGKRGDATRPGPPTGGAKVEVTLHKPATLDTWPDTWHAFARPARKLKTGDMIAFAPGFHAIVRAKLDAGEVTLHFNAAGPDLMAKLEAHGVMPLPPYIKRGAEGLGSDRHDYQTMFAAQPGAAAAPTAGLHFTPALMQAIEQAGVSVARLTLHVGAGTFLPVKTDDTRDHPMHAEWGEISVAAADAVNRARAAGGRVLAVGSTAMRLLETAADEGGRVHPFQGETDIFITPGYRFRAVDLMFTNFHLPRSTLFMLVAAFSGLGRMRTAYAHAIAAGYRFYSYGDACLLEPDRESWGNQPQG
jgi:S-adenosylmethionine:tRNA ribosyltransferase-isomerase